MSHWGEFNTLKQFGFKCSQMYTKIFQKYCHKGVQQSVYSLTLFAGCMVNIHRKIFTQSGRKPSWDNAYFGASNLPPDSQGLLSIDLGWVSIFDETSYGKTLPGIEAQNLCSELIDHSEISYASWRHCRRGACQIKKIKTYDNLNHKSRGIETCEILR